MELRDLLAVEEIKTLKARYFRLIDTKEWAALYGLFTDDATLSFPEIDPAPYSRDGGVKMIRQALSGCTSIHHGHMPEIAILSADTAQAVWAMEDILYWSEASQDVFGRAFTHGWGHYHETYRRIGGQWLIASLKLTRLRVESVLAPLRIP